MVKEVNDGDWKNVTAEKSGFVLIDVFADWCGPCRKLKPVLDELEQKYPKFVFLKMNSDNSPGFCAQFKVTSLPTVILLKGDREIDRIVGFDPSGLEAKLIKYSA